MFRVFIAICLMVSTSCVPRSVNNQEKEPQAFTIMPKGIWDGLCIDNAPMTAQSDIGISGHKRSVEFLSNDRVKFTTDFINGSCADVAHKIQLRHIREGVITYKQGHRDFNEETRLRGFSVKMNREYLQARTKAGLEYMRVTRELGMNSRVGDTIEIDSDDFFFMEAEGFLAVKKDARNMMNVFVDTEERMSAINDDDTIELNLVNRNLYVQNKIK